MAHCFLFYLFYGSSNHACGIGSAGFVAINNVDSSWTNTFTTSLPAGTYCDVISGSKTTTGCSGNTYAFSSLAYERDSYTLYILGLLFL